MGSRPAPDRYELAGVDELRELAVSLFRLQVQKLLDIAPMRTDREGQRQAGASRASLRGRGGIRLARQEAMTHRAGRPL